MTKKERLQNSVLELVSKNNAGIKAAEIAEILKEQCDRVTVYRILKRMEDAHKLHKIVDFDGIAKYFACSHSHLAMEHTIDNHVHFSCTKCLDIICLENSNYEINLPPNFIAKLTNFSIQGICSKCNSV